MQLVKVRQDNSNWDATFWKLWETLKKFSGRNGNCPSRSVICTCFRSSVTQSGADSLLNAGMCRICGFLVFSTKFLFSSVRGQAWFWVWPIHAHFCHLLIIREIPWVELKCSLLFLSGPVGSSGLTSAYVPSFLKKDVGSAGQRVQLAPVVDPSSSKYGTKVVLYLTHYSGNAVYPQHWTTSLLYFICKYLTDWNYS